MHERPVSENQEPLGDLAKRLLHDVNVLARNHVHLAKVEAERGIKKAALEAVGVILGGTTALIGFAMLCATLVVALAPVIPPLWARMLLCSATYLVLGGAVAGLLVRRLKRDATPELPRTRLEARATTHALREQVQHG